MHGFGTAVMHGGVVAVFEGMLSVRGNGLDVETDEETRTRFDELCYLEHSIGGAGRLTMRPFLQMTTKDLRQLYVLRRQALPCVRAGRGAAGPGRVNLPRWPRAGDDQGAFEAMGSGRDYAMINSPGRRLRIPDRLQGVGVHG